MKAKDLLRRLEGVQTIKSVMALLNVNTQKAIYLVHRLRKKGYVKTKRLKEGTRVYDIAFEHKLGGISYYDVLNEFSPIKIIPPNDYRIYGKRVSPEETLVYSIKTKSLRTVLASLALFNKVDDWKRLYRLAKLNRVERQVGALYDLTRKITRTRKMPKQFRNNALPKKPYGYVYTIDGIKSNDFNEIQKAWRVHLPFNKKRPGGLRMIKIDRYQNLLLAIANLLKRPIKAYAIGGNAMMYWGFKEATVDIDLVFESEKDRDDFKNAAEDLGYRETDSVKIYGVRQNRPIMLRLGDERFDLFVNKVIDFNFSKNIRQRAAEKIIQYGSNLMLHIANPHDLILMKCATDRLKDEDDARRIIQNTDIDWKIIIGEANQIALGEERAIFDLGIFLSKLQKTTKIPTNIIDQLMELLEKQIKEKKKHK